MNAELMRAELAMLEQEEAFVAAKVAGGVTREQRAGLREARRRFRELREGIPSGRAVARPGRVKGRSSVTGKGA